MLSYVKFFSNAKHGAAAAVAAVRYVHHIRSDAVVRPAASETDAVGPRDASFAKHPSSA